MKISSRIAGLTVVLAALGAPAASSAARDGISVAGSCIAGVIIPYPHCETPMTMNPTFRYAIVTEAPTQWSVAVTGTGGPVIASWSLGDPKVGTLRASGCPCRAEIWLSYPGQVIPNSVGLTSIPIGVVTSLGPR